MKTFYRYYRPLAMRRTNETFTRRDGGICLRFEQLPEGDLFFTAAICHPDDTFSKVVSKKITDSRADHMKRNEHLLKLCRGIEWTQNSFDLAKSVQSVCMQSSFSGQVDLPSTIYHRWHLKQVGEALTELMRENIQLTLVSEALLTAHVKAAEPYYREKACGT